MRILVTGAAGFIGFHVAEALLSRGHEVQGFDNLNAYYDPALKEARLRILRQHRDFTFVKGALEDSDAVRDVFERFRPERVVHLAAQAGVRHSIDNPRSYIASNLAGFLSILEGCRHHQCGHLVFASSSSVYGLNAKLPFAESDVADAPASLYGATKKSNELMAHAYTHLYGVPATALRFFTVYGPWGRPDMAPFLFTKKIIEGRPIDVYNQGHHARDFTYISDVTDGVLRVLDKPPQAKENAPPFEVYNIGNNVPIKLLDFIACIERAVGRTAIKTFLPMQPGDVLETYANIEKIERDTGFKPTTPIEVGIPKLVDWYRECYPGS